VARCCVLWPAVFTDPMVGGGTSMAGAREIIESGFNILARGRPEAPSGGVKKGRHSPACRPRGWWLITLVTGPAPAVRARHNWRHVCDFFHRHGLILPARVVVLILR
jgi:hypothetical protein